MTNDNPENILKPGNEGGAESGVSGPLSDQKKEHETCPCGIYCELYWLAPGGEICLNSGQPGCACALQGEEYQEDDIDEQEENDKEKIEEGEDEEGNEDNKGEDESEEGGAEAEEETKNEDSDLNDDARDEVKEKAEDELKEKTKEEVEQKIEQEVEEKLAEEAIAGTSEFWGPVALGCLIVLILMIIIFLGFMAIGTENAGGSTNNQNQIAITEVPLYKQWDPRWGGNTYGCGGTTIASSGCGVTSLAMVMSYLTGTEILPSETARVSLQKGWRVCGRGTSWSAMTEMPKIYGLKGKSISWNEAKTYLASGNPIIQSQGPGYFTNGGHFIVITGISGGEYLINDPDGKHRTKATEQQITSSLKANWVITK